MCLRTIKKPGLRVGWGESIMNQCHFLPSLLSVGSVESPVTASLAVPTSYFFLLMPHIIMASQM